MLQIIITLLVFVALVIPAGSYVYKIADHKKTFADPVFNRIDNGIYRAIHLDKKEMGWKQYAAALLLTNAVMVFLGYGILRIQSVPFFNPNGAGNMEPSLAFNTIISFITNTNLQHYAGETGLSYLSQMMVITMLMFTSAATGFAACAAFSRGITGRKSLGNFYVDFVRIITRALIPFAILVALILVSQGTPQNLSQNITLQTLEGKYQDVAMGPMASLVSIKHLGTNGGGFLGANSSTPLENPTIVSNIIQLVSMMLFPGACVIMFGLMFHNRKQQDSIISAKAKKGNLWFGEEGRTLFIAMSVLFLIGLGVCYMAESAGNPVLSAMGIETAPGSMEGKETRFGIAQSALFTTTTTSFTTGSVNNMHDSLTPLGGMVALLHMMFNMVFGGMGVGLMNMVVYVLLAVFLCGLMVGRSPEYLGKKVESREMKLAVLCILMHPLLVLGFTAVAVGTSGGQAGVSNPGFHGLSQILYEFASSAANNGSGFEGLGDNTWFWNITTGIVMFLGRYIAIVIQLAIAGSFLMKNEVNETVGTLKTSTITFALTLTVICYIFAALTFFPVLSLGPIAEHLTIWG